ncbi:hypothetical protein M758_1G263300 [Ceratodon purpureus]|nr:hypothetical protein M758_1G263300 [Ceratodon purpureus]
MEWNSRCAVVLFLLVLYSGFSSHRERESRSFGRFCFCVVTYWPKSWYSLKVEPL